MLSDISQEIAACAEKLQVPAVRICPHAAAGIPGICLSVSVCSMFVQTYVRATIWCNDLQDALHDQSVSAILQCMAADTSLRRGSSGTEDLNAQGVQYYQGMLALDLARLRENLECDTPSEEDVDLMAEFLGIQHDDSLFVREVCVLPCSMNACLGPTVHSVACDFCHASHYICNVVHVRL